MMKKMFLTVCLVFAATFASPSLGQKPPGMTPAPINTSFRKFDAFVSPDEQTIIFSSERPGGFGGADIYVSFRDGRGNWSEPATKTSTGFRPK